MLETEEHSLQEFKSYLLHVQYGVEEEIIFQI